MYRNIISGYYTGYYEMPLLDNTDYLKSNGKDGWQSQSYMERYLGSAASTVKSFTSDYIGGLDIASRPKWTIDGGGEPYGDIEIKVMLFNDNIASTYNNMAFVHSFVGGNLWYQDAIVQKAPSLYDVELPGRMRYYFCACTVSVKFSGKVRVVSSNNISSDDLRRVFAKNGWFHFTDLVEMNPYVLNNIPDAYDITFTFTPLLPNNYNTYFAYIQNDEKDSVKGVGSSINNIWTQFLDTFDASLNQASSVNAGEQKPLPSIPSNPV